MTISLMAEQQVEWEYLWAPYDQGTYQLALREISPADAVLDIGAGDLRFSLQIAAIARQVIAVEIQEEIVRLGPHPSAYPHNLKVEIADALVWPFPEEITTAVLLMRHCSRFTVYAEKLRRVGCQRLITNARWRMGVEVIDLLQPRLAYQDSPPGWYACWCGAVGFIPGDFNPDELDYVSEVSGCPACVSKSAPTAHLLNPYSQITNN